MTGRPWSGSRPRGARKLRPLADVLLSEPGTQETTFRNVRVEDAAAIWRLVRDSGVLDPNSPYAYLLLCHHHQRTCLVAEEAGEVVGFITAYVPPASPDVIFVWQIGVAASHRRRGLGRRLVHQLLDRCPQARFLEATVAPSNQSSLGLFRSVANDRGAGFAVHAGFTEDDFPAEASAHEQEDLIRIGPLAAPPSQPSSTERSASP